MTPVVAQTNSIFLNLERRENTVSPCLFVSRISVSIVLLLAGTLPGVSAASDSDLFEYDARMAFLKAGELALSLSRTGEDYEVEGLFQTSRAMSNYYSWNGVFAAVGKWRGEGPVTTAYMARTTGKDQDLKIVLTYENGARILDDKTGQFEAQEKPGGIDLISALFFHPGCYQGGSVHDGEDTYQLELRRAREHSYNGGRGYYRGQVTSCDYKVVDHKGRKRRVIVSLGDVAGQRVAVQVRAKIPVLPDAVFRLRMPQLSAGIAAETAQEMRADAHTGY